MLKVKEGTGSGIPYAILVLLMIIMAFFNDAWRIVMYIITIPTLLLIPSLFKEIQMSEDSCIIKVLFWKRIYCWNAFETVRFLDFNQCSKGGHYGGAPYFSEGILFYTRRIRKYPVKLDPTSYLILHDPLGLHSFFIQFPPESSYTKKQLGVPEYGFYQYRLDREEFMSKVEEWGLKIEGLNVPMPPEQLAAKKRK